MEKQRALERLHDWAELEYTRSLQDRHMTNLLKALADTCAILDPAEVFTELEVWDFLTDDTKATWKARIEEAAGHLCATP